MIPEHMEQALVDAYPDIPPEELVARVRVVDYKLRKAAYHLAKMRELEESIAGMPVDANHYDAVLLPMSFEAESAVQALRSAVEALVWLAGSVTGMDLDLTRPWDWEDALDRSWPLVGAALKGLLHGNPRLRFLRALRNEVAHRSGLPWVCPLRLSLTAGARGECRATVTMSVDGQERHAVLFLASALEEVSSAAQRVVYALVAQRRMGGGARAHPPR